MLGPTYMVSLCEWMAEQGAGILARGETLLKTTINRKLWKAIITHVLKDTAYRKKYMLSVILALILFFLVKAFTTHFCSKIRFTSILHENP